MDSTERLPVISGLDLKLARVARGLSQRAIARQLRVSPQRVSGIEGAYRPTTQVCARYLAALEALSAGPELVDTNRRPRNPGRPGIDTAGRTWPE